MAKHLWLLRHGEAVPHGSRPDSDRELTPRGVHQGQIAGRALAKLGIEFDACYTSPKVRGRDTAAATCEELGCSFEEVPALAEDFDVDDALELFTRHGDDACILVVGHEPDFSQVVHDLAGGTIDFKKGGIAGVKLTGSRRGELVVLLRPRELEAMAG